MSKLKKMRSASLRVALLFVVAQVLCHSVSAQTPPVPTSNPERRVYIASLPKAGAKFGEQIIVPANEANKSVSVPAPVSATTSSEPKLSYYILGKTESLITTQTNLANKAAAALSAGAGKSGSGAVAKAAAAASEMLGVAKDVITREQRTIAAAITAVTSAPGSKSPSVARASAATNPEVFTTQRVLNAAFATLTQGQAADLQNILGQGYTVAPVPQYSTNLLDSVPLIGATRSRAELTDGAGRAIDGRGVRVGVIDTGIDYRHPAFGSCTTTQFLSGACTKVPGGFDFTRNGRDAIDDGFHGTHVAATIAGIGDTPGPGVAPGAMLYALKVCEGHGGCGGDAIIRALEWAVDPNGDGNTSDHLDVVNMSIGGPGNADDILSRAADNAVAAGVVVVAAAGNNGPGAQTIGSPGAARSAITVAASTARPTNGLAVDELAGFSSRGPALDGAGQPVMKPDITAPGVNICAAAAMNSSVAKLSACANNQGISISGTSMATPHITGAVALMKQRNRSWSPEQIKSALMRTAQSMINRAEGRRYEPFEVGMGRVDVFAALQGGGPAEEPRRVELFTSGTVSSTSGVVVRGAVYGSGLQRWTLEAQFPGRSGWQVVAQDTRQVDIGEVLAAIDLSQAPAGPVPLRLTGVFGDETLERLGTLKVSNLSLNPIAKNAGGLSRFYVYAAPSEQIEIRGSAGGGGFSRYELLVCHPTAAEPECSSAGLVTASDGRTAVSDGLLGYLVPAAIPFVGDIEIKLRLYRGGFPVEEASVRTFKHPADGITVLTPPPMQDANDDSIGAQLVADLGDGRGQRLFTVRWGRVDCQDMATQTVCPGFPTSAGLTGFKWFVTLQLRDIDHDGVLELVVFDRSFESYGLPAHLVILRADGSSMLVRELEPLASLSSFVKNQFAFADLDGDGMDEVLYPSYSRNYLIHALKITGGEAPGFPVELAQEGLFYGGQTFSPITVADLNNDNSPEIVVVGLKPRIASPQDFYDYDTQVHLLSAHGAIAPGWPVILPGNRQVQVALSGNVAPGGAPGIVLTTTDRQNHYIHLLTAAGQQSAGFPVRTPADGSEINSYEVGDISLADLTGDGIPEIIDATQSALSIYDPQRQEFLAGWRKKDYAGGEGIWPSYQVLVANIDADPEPELITMSNFSLRGYPDPAFGVKAFNLDGSLVAGFPRVLPNSNSDLSIFNDAATGRPNLLFSGWVGVFSLALSGCAGDVPLWSQYGGDLAGSNTTDAAHQRWGAGCARAVTEPPTFLLQPQSFEFIDSEGRMRDLRTLVSGPGRIALRWQSKSANAGTWQDQNWVAQDSVTFPPFFEFGDTYRVLASNEAGTTVSEEARIGDSNYPVIVDQSHDKVVPPGTRLRLEVLARCNLPLTYQWHVIAPGSGYESITGATASSIEVTPATEGMYQYWATVGCGSVFANSRSILVTAVSPTATPTATATATASATATALSPTATPTATATATASATATALSPTATPTATATASATATALSPTATPTATATATASATATPRNPAAASCRLQFLSCEKSRCNFKVISDRGDASGVYQRSSGGQWITEGRVDRAGRFAVVRRPGAKLRVKTKSGCTTPAVTMPR